MFADTIVAVSTGPVAGPIALIRITGPNSLKIFSKLFSARKKLSPRNIYHGWITNPKNNEPVDEILAWCFLPPKSFTGEEMVEISCHGSPQIVKEIIEIFIENGGRLAGRGEFTKRAFINGKLDLTQAEAIIDLIEAKTEKSASSARSQLMGELKRLIEGIREKVKQILMKIEATLDFPDDIEEIVSPEEIKKIISEIDDTIKTSKYGKLVREGISLAIIGRPNVGKSSLLNLLLKDERAIVADIPGTTRDTIEEQINVRGYLINLVDTAGLHNLEVGAVESMGMNRTRAAASEADIILFVCEATDPFNNDDNRILSSIDVKKAIYVVNKTDLRGYQAKEGEVGLSIVNRIGIVELEDRIVEKIENIVEPREYGGINERQKERLIVAENALKRGAAGINAKATLEMIAIDIKEGFDALGEITGQEGTEEVIAGIFDRFCV